MNECINAGLFSKRVNFYSNQANSPFIWLRLKDTMKWEWAYACELKYFFFVKSKVTFLVSY